MKYRVSKEANEILNNFDPCVKTYMTYCLRNYFATGKCPQLDSVELRNLWFYLKCHELAENVQLNNVGYYGSWYGSFSHIELRELLAKNCYKFINRYFKVGGYHNGPSESES